MEQKNLSRRAGRENLDVNQKPRLGEPEGGILKNLKKKRGER